MTNGSVSRHCRIALTHANARYRKGSGTTLVVQYQTALRRSSASECPVMEVAPEKVVFGEGDTVYVATEKLPDGTLTTNKISNRSAVSPNTQAGGFRSVSH